jgi:hypothetical protein
LIHLETDYATNPISRVSGKFAELGKWTQAEKAFRIGVEHFGDKFYFPIHMSKVISTSNDTIRFRQWGDICSTEKSKASLLYGVCAHYARTNKVPSPSMIIEIAALRDQIDVSDALIARTVDQTLMIAYWADGFRAKSEVALKRILNQKDNQRYLPSMVSDANAVGLPELAVRIAAEIKNDGQRKGALLQGGQINRTTFEPKKIRDEEWLKTQPVDAQIAYKMQLAKQLLMKEKATDQ